MEKIGKTKMTLICDPWQTTFFFNIRANFKTGLDGDPPEVTLSLPLGEVVPSATKLKDANDTATAALTEALRSAIDTALSTSNTSAPPLLGSDDWKVVWGPQVYCVAPQAISHSNGTEYTATYNATNAMYVVHSARLKRYIIAVAGTDNPSLYDWLVEDFTTDKVISWDGALHVWRDGITTVTASAIEKAASDAAIAAAAAPDIPCISYGTFAGTTILLNIIDTVITKKTLVDFLKELSPPAGTTLTFTGHSLGGALAPTLAMACFAPGTGLLMSSAWSSSDTMVYPTAGATPGNKHFADLFNGTGWGGAGDYGKQPWQVWNTVLYNSLDIVPHAWGDVMLRLIPDLYSLYYAQSLKDLAEIYGLIAIAREIAEKGEAIAGAYTPINNRPLNSTKKIVILPEFFSEYTVGGAVRYLTLKQALSTLPTSTEKGQKIPLTTQAALQHTIAYGILLNIPKKLLPGSQNN